MADLTVGKKAPLFTLPSDGGQDISLSDYKGGKVILYFYPKDNTSGCTLEAQAFRANLEEFKKRGYSVLGVSRDSVKKHCNFRDKYELNFPLLSDEKETVCNLYGVMKEKSMYGKKYMGIERSTFIKRHIGERIQERESRFSCKRSAEGPAIANYKEAVTKYFCTLSQPLHSCLFGRQKRASFLFTETPLFFHFNPSDLQ